MKMMCIHKGILYIVKILNVCKIEGSYTTKVSCFKGSKMGQTICIYFIKKNDIHHKIDFLYKLCENFDLTLPSYSIAIHLYE